MLRVNSCFIRMPVDSWCQRSKQSEHAKLNLEAGRSVGLYSGLCCKKACLVTLFAGFYNLATRKHEACGVRTRVFWFNRCNKIFPPCDHDFSPGTNNAGSIWLYMDNGSLPPPFLFPTPLKRMETPPLEQKSTRTLEVSTLDIR